MFRKLGAKYPTILGCGALERPELEKIWQKRGIEGLLDVCCSEQKIVPKGKYHLNNECHHVDEKVAIEGYSHLQFFLDYDIAKKEV